MSTTATAPTSILMLRASCSKLPFIQMVWDSTNIDRAERRIPAGILRSARSIFVESHTIWMKGNLLQDARNINIDVGAVAVVDIYIDVTRPWLTYDWIFKMIKDRKS